MMKINSFRGDLTDISAKKEALIVGIPISASIFKLEYVLFGYFDPEKFLKTMT